MPDTIISDSSCLIVFDKMNELNILNELYGKIFTTTEVAAEYGKALPDWIEIKEVKNKNNIIELENIVDKGEASAIALAVEVKDCVIIIDDLKARNLAKRIGLNITGTLGIILKAKQKGIITSVKPMIFKLRKTNFRLTKNLENNILFESGE